MFVLIHGAWHTAATWDHLRASLSALGATSTAIDLPGRSGDDTSASELTLEAYADRVFQALDSIDEPVTLVGHSLGGKVAMALHRPDPAALREDHGDRFLLDHRVERDVRKRPRAASPEACGR